MIIFFFFKKLKFLIITTIIIFNFKNIMRISNELNRNDQYKFLDFPFFSVEKKKFKKIKLDKNFELFITDGYCWATPTPCSNTEQKNKVFKNYLIFKR